MKAESGSCARALSTRVSRRVFLYDCGRMLGAMLLPLLGDVRARTAAVGSLRVLALVAGDGDSPRPSLRRGIEMGAVEATHTMALFGMSLTLTVRTVSSTGGAAAAERAAVRGTRAIPSVIIRAMGDACLTTQPSPSVPTIDIACDGYEVSEVDANTTGESPRSRATPASAKLLLRIRPSTSTLRRVQSQVTDTLPSAPNVRRRVELWHPSLERFGGDQLNERYQRRFGEPMDSDAWAGWVAIKIAAEASLRAHATTPAALAGALTDSSARFDGHKGHPLTFHPASHELLQPLYVVDADTDSDPGKVVAEFVPEGP
jgi:hypothetical protein